MSIESVLRDKAVLIVDDEPDILDSISEQLDMCRIYRAKDYEIALQLMAGFKFDIVVLDVMGVRGFELLKKSVSKGFPTVMLTAHAMTPDALKESIKLLFLLLKIGLNLVFEQLFQQVFPQQKQLSVCWTHA